MVNVAGKVLPYTVHNLQTTTHKTTRSFHRRLMSAFSRHAYVYLFTMVKLNYSMSGGAFPGGLGGSLIFLDVAQEALITNTAK